MSNWPLATSALRYPPVGSVRISPVERASRQNKGSLGMLTGRRRGYFWAVVKESSLLPVCKGAAYIILLQLLGEPVRRRDRSTSCLLWGTPDQVCINFPRRLLARRAARMVADAPCPPRRSSDHSPDRSSDCSLHPLIDGFPDSSRSVLLTDGRADRTLDRTPDRKLLPLVDGIRDRSRPVLLVGLLIAH